MSKLLKVLLVIFATITLFSALLLYQALNPTLSQIQVNKNNEVGVYISPDEKKSITVYFNGGLIFYNDVTYVGVLEDFNSGLKKNIFLVLPDDREIGWINNETITVNGIELAINDTYDFRNE